MATLPRTINGQLNKTEYKDYVHFLGNYKSSTNKKDQDQFSIHTNDSGISVRSYPLSNSSNNTSSSSLNSENSEITKNFCSSYTNYLENYKNKKFQPVKPNFDETLNSDNNQNTSSSNNNNANNNNNINNNDNNKIMKTEIFIEVEQPKNYVTEVSKKFEHTNNNSHVIKTHPQHKNGIVQKINIFENNDKQAQNSTLRRNQINKISNELKSVKMTEKPTIKSKPEHMKLNSCDQLDSTTIIQQKFVATNSSPPVLSQISSKNSSNFVINSNIKHNIPSPPPPSVIPSQNGLANSKQNFPTPPILQLSQNSVPSSKENIPAAPHVMPFKNCIPNSKQNTLPMPVIQSSQTSSKPNIPLSPAMPTSQNCIANSKPNIPLPPVMPPQNFVVNSKQNIPTPPAMPSSPNFIANSKPTQNPSPVIPQQIQKTSPLPPTPPPMMPNNFKAPLMNRTETKSTIVRRNSENGNSIRTMNTETVVPITNGNQKLDKNNPLVRKLVYGTLRGMYSAHHDKANDFLATLPQYMVKKENGIQNIINTIASNGDLEKLNGRVNPKVDQE